MVQLRGWCAALFLLAATQAFAQDKVELKWKFEKGKTFYQEQTVEAKGTTKVQGLDIHINSQQTLVVAWTPVTQLDDKGWIVSQQIAGLKLVMDMANKKIVYDSQKTGDAPKEFADALKPLIGAEFKLTIGPDWKATKVEGLEGLRDKLGEANPLVKQLTQGLLTEETFKQMADQQFALLPAKPVAKGASWTVDSKLPMGGNGTFVVRNKHTYEGKDGAMDKIKVETTYLKFEAPAAKGPPQPFKLKSFDMKNFKSTAAILFDATKGRVERSSQDTNLEGVLTVEIGGQDVEVGLSQSQKIASITTDTNPIKQK
ncbi:MAG: hypothetical protein K2R98_03875 [Gemmataceae bacterium]|nr:hypothetical protein [Gemmataceae bacterium]